MRGRGLNDPVRSKEEMRAELERKIADALDKSTTCRSRSGREQAGRYAEFLRAQLAALED